MKNLYPSAMADRVYRITPQLLKSWGVKGLILDIDNTLTTHDNPIPDAGVSAWLEQNRREGIAMIVLSNNKPERVEPFAKILGLDYISNGAKPLKKGYQRCAQPFRQGGAVVPHPDRWVGGHDLHKHYFSVVAQ